MILKKASSQKKGWGEITTTATVDYEAVVREATVTSLEKASNSAFSLIGPETLKNWKEDSFSKFCAERPPHRQAHGARDGTASERMRAPRSLPAPRAPRVATRRARR